MTQWEFDKKWSDRFIPEIKQIIGPAILSEAPFFHDSQRATDLIVLTCGSTRGVAIACRMRRYGYYEKYKDDITIRLRRVSGTQTEAEKIVNGFADYYFYGHSSVCCEKIEHYYLIDLNIFRASLIRASDALKHEMLQINRNVNENEFLVFKVSKFPPSMIIRSA